MNLHPEQVRDHICMLARSVVSRAVIADAAREERNVALASKWDARAAEHAHEAHDFAREHAAVLS